MPMYGLFDFTHGLDTTVFPPNLPANGLVRAHNAHLRARGFDKRIGYRRVSSGGTDSATQPIMGLHLYRTPAGTRFIVRVRNALIEYMTGGAWTAITGALTVSTTVRTKMDVFRGNIVGTDTANVPWKWPGSGNAASIATAIAAGADTIDKCATLCMHRERLVLGDVTATESASQTRYESVLWPSDVGTLDTWSASPTGKIHVGQGDGDSITNILSVLGYLVVLKQNSIWRVSDYGASTQVLLRVGNVGSSCRFGAIVVDSLVYFIDDEFRLWSYDPRQGDSPDALTDHTSPRSSLTERANLAADDDTAATRGLVYWKDQRLILAFCGDRDFDSTPTTPNCAWVYHIDLGHARTKWNWLDDWKTYACGISADYTAHPALYLGSTDGYVARVLGNRTDDATGSISGTNTVIDTDVYTSPNALEDPDHMKGLNYAYFYTNSLQTLHNVTDAPTDDTLTVERVHCLPENGSSGAPNSWSVTMPDQGDGYDSAAEQRMDGAGRFFQFRLRQNTSRHMRFGGMLVNYRTLGERR